MKERSDWEIMNMPLDAAQRIHEYRLLEDAKILKAELEKAARMIDGKQLLINIEFRKKYGFSEDPKPTMKELFHLYFECIELQKVIKNDELDVCVVCFWNALKELSDHEE